MDMQDEEEQDGDKLQALLHGSAHVKCVQIRCINVETNHQCMKCCEGAWQTDASDGPVLVDRPGALAVHVGGCRRQEVEGSVDGEMCDSAHNTDGVIMVMQHQRQVQPSWPVWECSGCLPV
eukprot:5982491-Amphidinium_carterae.1